MELDLVHAFVLRVEGEAPMVLPAFEEAQKAVSRLRPR